MYGRLNSTDAGACGGSRPARTLRSCAAATLEREERPAATPESERAARLAEALGLLEVFAEQTGAAWDRGLGRRVLAEAATTIGGDDAPGWMQRLVEVGESVNLRIRRVECRLEEALAFVHQGLPVATIVREAEGLRAWVIVAARGRRVVIADARNGVRQTLSRRKARRRLQLAERGATASWLLGQAPLTHAPAEKGGGDHDGHEPTPWERLHVLLLPERKDLGAIVIFSLAVGMLALATPVAVEALVNTVAFGRYLQPVVVLSLILFIFLGFAAAIRALLAYIVEILQRRLLVRVVEDLAYRLPRVRQESLDGRHGPELVNRFFDIVTVQKAAAGLLLDGAALAIQTVVGMAVLAFYHPFLLGFDLLLLAFMAFVIFVLGRGAVKTSVKESKAKYALAEWLEELARHPTAFKLHGGQTLALDRADQLAVEYLAERKKHFRVLMRQIVFALGLQAAAATTLLGLGGWLVIQGQLTLGQLVAAELIVTVIVGSFSKVGKHLETFYDLLASVDKLGMLFDLPTEPHDRLFHLRETSPASLAVRGVSYRYPGGGFALRDCTLHLAPGDRVALVGPAGSGKSTLLDLLCGVRLPTSGHIELDGIDLREVRPDSLREHLGMARNVEIFHGTLGANVHLHRPHLNARDVREALDLVGLLDEALQLPEGLNTVLTTGGAPLSHGQACRLMLARAIVARPRLLVIDGLLDGLPEEQVEKILDQLAAPGAPWTLLVATHRAAVRRRCLRELSLAAPRPAPAAAVRLGELGED